MVNIEIRDKVEIITFSVNKINALITDEVREEISVLFDKSNSKVVIDLSGIEYIDSSGFCCFLSVMKTAKHKYGVLKFVIPDPKINDLFNILHLETVLQIYPDMESCLRSI
jgi:anti-sigma B factor antagonist